MFIPFKITTGTKNPAIGAHRLNLKRKIGIQIKNTQMFSPPLHQEGAEFKKSMPAKSPPAAGLNIWRLSNLTINLINMEIALIDKRIRGCSPNWATKPIIKPVIKGVSGF